MIVVTHDNRVLHFGDRIIHMNDGRIENITGPEPAGAGPTAGPGAVPMLTAL